SSTDSDRRPRKSILRRPSIMDWREARGVIFLPLTLGTTMRIERQPAVLETMFFHLGQDPLNRKHLGRCALVCRRWAYLSRPFFLPTLSLDQTNKSTFFTLTSSPCCTISNSISTLNLNTRVPAQCFQEYNKFSRVRTLRLLGCTFETMAELGEFVSNFRGLKNLFLSGVEWVETPRWLSFSRPHETLPHDLQSLEIYLPSEGHCGEFIHLRTLKFGGRLGTEDISSINNLLSILGSRLKNLYLYNTKLLPLDLSQSNGLESLFISHIPSKVLYTNGRCLQALSQLAKTNITQLGFHLVDDLDVDNVELIDWTALKQMLSSFPALKRLDFGATAGKKIVKHELIQFKTKGILHVH
ncbi:hypothetical protein DL96DRAFT_1591783, partial [Flagelloscypha sp. PMI_526]